MSCCNENESSAGYCKRCKGMMWSLFGILLILNHFVWPMWDNTIGEFAAFIGILLMLGGVWKAYVTGCACHEKSCCKNDSVQKLPEAPALEVPKTETTSPNLFEIPVESSAVKPAKKKIAHHATKKKK